MNKLIPILIVVFAINTQAVNFTGHWITDTGKASSTIGLGGDCKKIEIFINHTDDKIITEKYVFDCGLLGSNWGPVTQTVIDGKVYEHDEEVGTLEGDTLLTVSYSGNVAYAYNLQLTTDNDGNPILRSYYGTQNGYGSIVVEGDLKKISP